MSNAYEISQRDKRLLESFDISIFKSAVAYMENARIGSSHSYKATEGLSPGITKKKSVNEVIPPLLPIESRMAILTQKYGIDSSAVVNRNKQENRQKIVQVLNYKRRDVPVGGSVERFGIDERGIGDKRRFSRHERWNSQAAKVSR